MCLGQSLELAKTTLRLPRELVKELKRMALETDRSLQQVATEALEEYVRRRQKHA
jgi:predicted transcriptional regulator